jgi:hypothetical protein
MVELRRKSGPPLSSSSGSNGSPSKLARPVSRSSLPPATPRGSRALSTINDTVQTQQRKFVSVGAAFKASLTLLVATLRETRPWFLRCIAPNRKQQATYFDRPVVAVQLKCEIFFGEVFFMLG